MQVNPEIKFKHNGKECKVIPERFDLAHEIDESKDNFIQDGEIISYLRKKDILHDFRIASADVPQILDDFKIYLKGEMLPQAQAYHTYESAVKEIKDLADSNPNIAQFVVLGKSAEGRDIAALKISSNADKDTSNKTGVVITGLTHAREWATMESALKIANDLVKGYGQNDSIKKRLDNLEIWVVPFVNPDGYVYSRGKDSWWRKNRRVIDDTGCNKGKTIGVDLNRNYYDGKPEHFTLWRPNGDIPCNTRDDFFQGADSPSSETYRGPAGASEPEIKTVLNLELNRPNIVAVLDIHSFGEMLLYPSGYTEKEVPNVKVYKELGAKINQAFGNRYELMQAIELYPTSGASMDIHQANDKISMTFEIGRSFFPKERELPALTEEASKGAMVFLDHWA